MLPFISILFFFFVTSFAQDKASNYKIEHFQAKTKYATLSIQAIGDKDSLDKQLLHLDRWIDNFNKAFSYNGPLDSLLYNAKEKSQFKLDSLSTELLKFGIEAYIKTDGGIDVGIGNLLRAWKIGWNQKSVVPSPDELARLVEELKTFPYTIDSSGTLTVLQTNRHIAMGSFLEARILIEIIKRLEKAHCFNYLVDFGGDMAYSGSFSRDAYWRIGIKRPDHPDSILTTIDLPPNKYKGISTSGSYEQYFIDENGKSHHHIFDPKTGQSTVGNLSITVLSNDPLENDLYDTWYMMLTLDQIKNHIKNSKGAIEAIVISDSNKVWISEGLKKFSSPIYPPFYLEE